MDYSKTLDFLYKRTPAYHQIGAGAYKPGLKRTKELDDLAGNPHSKYKIIHIAGTNGKGSVAHLLAAAMQASGYKVGLYTSPHLIDFRERIRINGSMIPKQYVTEFVRTKMHFITEKKLSFFEVITILAFDYFRHKKVHYAIIETGMGGRLDSTNIIDPIISIITNISLDHTQYLGNTLLDIAKEKAGIIKENTPVIIGETQNEELRKFFKHKALEKSAPLMFANKEELLSSSKMNTDGSWELESIRFGKLTCGLRGPSQKFNTQTVLAALKLLSDEFKCQLRYSCIKRAFENVNQMTRFMGRWQELNATPKVICDIGHNIGAWEQNAKMLEIEISKHEKTHIIIGLSNDKDIDGIFSLLPKDATYYFTQASGKRALPAEELALKGLKTGLHGKKFDSVQEAIHNAVKNSSKNDLIFIGGSSFVVAEVLPMFPNAIKY